MFQTMQSIQGFGAEEGKMAKSTLFKTYSIFAILALTSAPTAWGAKVLSSVMYSSHISAPGLKSFIYPPGLPVVVKPNISEFTIEQYFATQML